MRRQDKAVELRLEGHSYKQIAQALGVSPQRAYQLYRSGLYDQQASVGRDHNFANTPELLWAQINAESRD